jgi:hypothetical protein
MREARGFDAESGRMDVCDIAYYVRGRRVSADEMADAIRDRPFDDDVAGADSLPG